VISFEVRPAWIHNDSFNLQVQNLAQNPNLWPSPRPEDMSQGNTDEPFSDLRTPSFLNPAMYPGPAGAFDTWNTMETVPTDWDNPFGSPGANGFLVPGVTQPPTRINVRALQIKVRLWDPKAEQARQATIINEG